MNSMNRMKNTTLALAVLGALGLATALQSCTRDARTGDPDDERVEVRFTGDVAQVATRSANSRIAGSNPAATRTAGADNTEWVAGDRVGVYMVDGGSNSTPFGTIHTANKPYTAQGGGGVRRSCPGTANGSSIPLTAMTFASRPTTPTRRM